MCGINGIVYSLESGRKVDPQMLIRMRDALRHRGPDEEGIFVEQNVGLGHRRLSIVDLSKGQQPMFNEDESLVIAYNGEIYNHADFRPELEAKGHIYKSHCDTETILHLYEEHGSNCVDEMRGMFAFAIWNRREKELFIARDRFGVKPLYYVHDDEGSLFFGSEIKALLEARAVKSEVNFKALPDQLANHGTSFDETLFKDVKRLLPGHVLVWKDGKVSIKKYWDLSFEPKNDIGSEKDLVEEWYELFKESVRLRLMADVPLGMFLSGGIDSSAIAAVMAGEVRERVTTFSVGFEEQEANELMFARQVSKTLGTEHHEITLSPEQFFSELPKMVWHEDEPIGFAASIPLFFISKLAQQYVKVVLTGEGSDEILAGYGRYTKAVSLLHYGEKYEAFVPQLVRGVVKAGVSALPGMANRKLNRTFLTRKAEIESLYFDNFAVFPGAMQARLLSDETKSRIGNAGPYSNLHKWLNEADGESALDKVLYVDTKTYLHELLMKQDQMSMAASIESRVPFLDHKLAEFSAKLPMEMKLRGNETKRILRKAMKGLLPDEILTRPKMGFPVPLGNWFRNQFRYLVDEFVLNERSLDRGIFAPAFVRELVRRHMAGENHDQRIWFLLNFEIWQRQFIDGEELRKN